MLHRYTTSSRHACTNTPPLFFHTMSILRKKITIDVCSLLVAVVLCYCMLSTYFLLKHHSGNNDQHEPEKESTVVPCKEGLAWKTECPTFSCNCPKCDSEKAKLSCPTVVQNTTECNNTVQEIIKEVPFQGCKNYERSYLRYGAPEQQCPFFATTYETWTSMPPMCDYLNLECVASNILLGVGSQPSGLDVVQRSFSDHMFTEFLLVAHPLLANITEVGTKSGTTSLFLGLVAKMRGGDLITFDKDDWRIDEVKRGWLDNMHFVKDNVLKEDTESQQLIDAITRPNSLVIYDGDDHMKEIQTYAPYQLADSVFVSHDFGDRILTSWIEETLTSNNFTELFAEFAAHLSTHVRAFKKAA